MAEDSQTTVGQDNAMMGQTSPMTNDAPTPQKDDSIRATVKEKLSAHAGDLRSQAAGKAHDYATQGKDRAVDALDSIVELVDGAADALERNLGSNVGEYAQRAAGAISGFAETLKQKDVEELLEDAKSAVRRNPAVAIGAAAAIGFVLARLVKSAGSEDDTTSAASTTPPPSAADIQVG